MPLHEEKHCPRCDARFECRAGAMPDCQCQRVELDCAQLDYIAGRYEDCLCAACLVELRREYNERSHRQRLAPLLRR